LNKLNVPLKFETVVDLAGEAAIGRPHIAGALLEEGYTDTYQEAFIKYIGTGGPAFEKKFQATAQDVIQLVGRAKGLTFLAHPSHYTTDFELSSLIQLGLDGIEVVHPSHSELRQDFYRGVVNQYFLLESGGSDLHGGKKGDDQNFGTFIVPLHYVEAMRNRLFA
jgi:predicted metal-dependent phosphoesterase TrpH